MTQREVLSLEVKDLEAMLAREEDDKARKRITEAAEASIALATEVPVFLAVHNSGTSGIRNLFIQSPSKLLSTIP
jgi:hypothetical protein